MAVVTALENAGVSGVTVIAGNGRGTHTPLATYRGVQYRPLLPVYVVDVIADDDAADDIVRTMLEHGHTGEHGDGHVLVMGIEECYRVRTRFLEVA